MCPVYRFVKIETTRYGVIFLGQALDVEKTAIFEVSFATVKWRYFLIISFRSTQLHSMRSL